MLKPRIHGLAFKREYTKNAFMDPTQWFVPDEALQRFNAEGKFSLS